MRRLTLLLLLAEIGSTEHLQATQLAAVSLNLARHADNGGIPLCRFGLALGGDITLAYAEMLPALHTAKSPGGPVRRCRVVLIPN